MHSSKAEIGLKKFSQGVFLKREGNFFGRPKSNINIVGRRGFSANPQKYITVLETLEVFSYWGEKEKMLKIMRYVTKLQQLPKCLVYNSG